jgi:thiol-disulfide isomerase/thioredoxin
MLRFKGVPEGVVTEPYQGKIVFIEFWGTWCGPCLLSIPHHVKLQEKYKDQLKIVSFETTPKVTRDELKKYISDPKNIDMKRVRWYLDNKAKTATQKKSLEEPVHTLEAFRTAGKPINYDVVASADAGQFVDYIAQRAGWQGYIPFLLVLDGEGKAAAMVPGMPSEEKLDGIIQSILKKKK